MKKLLLIFTFITLLSVPKEKDKINTFDSDGKNTVASTNSTESKTEIETGDISLNSENSEIKIPYYYYNDNHIYSSGENFTIYLEDLETKTFKLDICKDNKILYTDKFYTKPPVVFPINSDSNVLLIYNGVGNPSPKYTYFYDLKNNIRSEIYTDADLLNYDYYNSSVYQGPKEKEFHSDNEYNDNLIYYLKFIPDKNYKTTEKGTIKLIIRDIFDKNKFYKEVERDFYKIFNPEYAIRKIKMTEDNILHIKYYKGENHELVSEKIDLNDL